MDSRCTDCIADADYTAVQDSRTSLRCDDPLDAKCVRIQREK